MNSHHAKTGVTWKIALKVWWWILVRTLVVVFVVALVFSSIDHFWSHAHAYMLPWIALLVGVAVQIYWIKKVIGQKFNDFTLTLTE